MATLYLASSKCSYKSPETKVMLTLKQFRLQMPLIENKNGFVVNTLWGDDKIPHLLNWDNHSPTWANTEVINNSYVTKSSKYLYRTTTADGTFIHGDVYKCSKIFFGDVLFKNVLFYSIPDKKDDKLIKNIDGVFGIDLIAKGIWKFDFKKKIITFASVIDSLTGNDESIILPSIFKDDSIQMDVAFANKSVKSLQVDFGYNGYVIMSPENFKMVSKSNDQITEDSFVFSTPASTRYVKSKTIANIIQISTHKFQSIVSTNNLMKENLIGRKFFEQFEFVIFDYINKVVYVSKNKHQ